MRRILSLLALAPILALSPLPSNNVVHLRVGGQPYVIESSWRNVRIEDGHAFVPLSFTTTIKHRRGIEVESNDFNVGSFSRVKGEVWWSTRYRRPDSAVVAMLERDHLTQGVWYNIGEVIDAETGKYLGNIEKTIWHDGSGRKQLDTNVVRSLDIDLSRFAGHTVRLRIHMEGGPGYMVEPRDQRLPVSIPNDTKLRSGEPTIR